MKKVDFRNHTREEAIDIIAGWDDDRFLPLIRWIAESIEFRNASEKIRVCIADMERRAFDKALEARGE